MKQTDLDGNALHCITTLLTFVFLQLLVLLFFFCLRSKGEWRWSCRLEETRPEVLGFGSAVDVTAMAIHPLRRKAESFVEVEGGPPEDSRAKG